MRSLATIGVTLCLAVSPLSGQRRELIQLQADIVRLTAQVEEIQQSLDERNTVVQDLVEQLYDRMGSLSQSVQRVTTTLNEVQDGNDILAGELRVLVSNLRDDVELMGRRTGDLRGEISSMSQQLTAMTVTSDQLSSPAGLMRMAVTDYLSGNYDLALEGFQEYLDNYPRSPRAAEAQLYLGEVHFTKREFDQALIEYDLLLQKYPDSDKKISGLYKKGLALAELGQTSDALDHLRRLVSDFPDSTEAAGARQKINVLTNQIKW